MSVTPKAEHARQFKRHGTAFRARIEPHPDHVEQFRAAFSEVNASLEVVDVSRGGLGLIGGIFVPRNLRLIIRIVQADSGQQAFGRDLILRALVRRCVMESAKPSYQLGLQFLDPAGRDERALVEAVLEERPMASDLSGGAGNAR